MSWRSENTPEEVKDLLTGCTTDDPAAWRKLLAYVRGLALELGRWRYHLSREDADDLAQLAQIRVADRVKQLRDPAAFPAWLRRLIHCIAIDILRARRPCCSLDDLLSPSNPAIAEPATEDDYSQVELRADLDKALDRLPDRYRLPIRLHLLEGLPQEEVGQILGRPRSTVASQIERGLRRMQQSLAATAL